MSEVRDNQIRRTARVLEMIQQIANTPRYWTRRKLAECHEVSERSIQKDIELIRIRLGLDLHTEGSGYFFNHLPHLPTTNFTFQEAIALLTAARAAENMPGINSAEIAAAIARLECVFPLNFRPFLKKTLNLQRETAEGTHRQSMLSLLQRAYYEQRKIRIRYQSNQSQNEVERVIEPYYILPYGRSWHVIAFDHLRGQVLQFKCDRLKNGELLEEHYRIPADFNLDEYFGDGWGMMRGAAGKPEEVLLHFNEVAGRWVTEEHWHRSQVNEAQADGSFMVRFFVGITPEMVNWLMYYGANVEILQPAWLRERVREEHRRAGGEELSRDHG
jgi:predicted DNA-binding transcriptional regulator YafY